jgi:hypothetical protein
MIGKGAKAQTRPLSRSVRVDGIEPWRTGTLRHGQGSAQPPQAMQQQPLLRATAGACRPLHNSITAQQSSISGTGATAKGCTRTGMHGAPSCKRNVPTISSRRPQRRRQRCPTLPHWTGKRTTLRQQLQGNSCALSMDHGLWLLPCPACIDMHCSAGTADTVLP